MRGRDPAAEMVDEVRTKLADAVDAPHVFKAPAELQVLKNAHAKLQDVFTGMFWAPAPTRPSSRVPPLQDGAALVIACSGCLISALVTGAACVCANTSRVWHMQHAWEKGRMCLAARALCYRC